MDLNIRSKQPLLHDSLLEKINFQFFSTYELNHDSESKSLPNTHSTNSVPPTIKDNYIPAAANAIMQYTISRTIGELVIINRGFEENQDMATLLENQYTTLIEKFESGVHDHIYYAPTMELYKEGLTAMIHYKLSHDIWKIKNMLEATVTELVIRGTVFALNTRLEYLKKQTKESHEIIFNYLKSEEYLQYLKAKQIDEAENYRILKNDWDELKEILQEKADDCEILSCIETRLISKWTVTRLEQREITIDIQRDALTEELNQLNKTIQNENDITGDIEEYLDFKIKKIDSMVEQWISRCDSEIDAMDDEIQVLTEHNKILEVRAQTVMDDYNSRQKEMEEYWEKKRLAAEAILLAQKRIKFAIRIQAWWRGTMVRRHLGPYRRHKRKKGKKGKKRGKK